MSEAPAEHGRDASLMRMMSGEDRSARGRLFRFTARVAAPFYAFATRVRNTAYEREWKTAHRAHCPVISVGNITSGGTGKTPMVMRVVELLREMGRRPAVVLRGYRGEGEAGSDEAALYRERLGGVPVIVEPDRVKAARRIGSKHGDVDAIVLDDGFQHRRLARDLDLVLIDATEPFGYGHVLPRGLLREPRSALGRADGVIVTRADALDADALRRLDTEIAVDHGSRPVAHARHAWRRIVDDRDRPVPADADARVFACCAIGNPRAFIEQARTRFELAGRLVLDDHDAFDAVTVGRLAQRVRDSGAEALLVTEKDWVKLRGRVESASLGVPVWRPELGVELIDGTDELRRMLDEAVHPEKLLPWTNSSN